MAEWRKAIPEARDRLQTLMLVWVVGPVLAVAAVPLIKLSMQFGDRGSIVGLACGISLTFALAVWALRAATVLGSFCGGTVCLLTILIPALMSGSVFHSGLPPLVALFVLTFAATRAGRVKKANVGLAEERHGRTAGQVLANLGMAGLLLEGCAFAGLTASADTRIWGVPLSSVMPVLLMACLCEATADTLASEIGAAFGGKPVMLTTLRKAEPGTDGAVSAKGTLAGVAGAAAVSMVGIWAMQMSMLQASAALTGGVAGLMFDSLLGATVERRGWLGNDLVNFSSTLFAAVFALGLLAILAGR